MRSRLIIPSLSKIGGPSSYGMKFKIDFRGGRGPRFQEVQEVLPVASSASMLGHKFHVRFVRDLCYFVPFCNRNPANLL